METSNLYPFGQNHSDNPNLPLATEVGGGGSGGGGLVDSFV